MNAVAVTRAPAHIGAGLRSPIASAVQFVLVWTAIAGAIFLLGQFLFDRGFISLNLLFFAEKARLAIAGMPPRLVNIGFVYPPLTFIMMLPFDNPIVGQAIIAGGTIAAAFQFLDRWVASAVRRRIAKVYLLISPIFLFLTVENYNFLLLAFLLALAVVYLGRYLDYGYSLYLFAAGALYGLTFFIDFRTVALLIVLVPSVIVPLYRRSLPQAISVALIVALPLLFMAVAWMYVNWVFLGDGLAFVHGRSSFFRTFVSSPDMFALAHNPIATIEYIGKLVALTLPVTGAYFVGLFLLRSNQSAYLIPTWAIYCFPLVLMSSSIYAGVFAPAASFLALFLLTLFFELPRMRRGALLTFALIVSLASSFAAPLVSPNSEERTFARAAFTGHIEPNISEYLQVVGTLKGTTGRILADDTIFYPVVYLLGQPKRFILPYEYEFDTALADPRLMARYVIASRDTGADAVTAVHLSIEQSVLRGYRPILSTEHYIVFVRVV